jgi:hypothetical protein
MDDTYPINSFHTLGDIADRALALSHSTEITPELAQEVLHGLPDDLLAACARTLKGGGLRVRAGAAPPAPGAHPGWLASTR